MAKPISIPEIISPKLYITQVSDDHKFLKISGQIDKETAVLVERLIATNKDKFEEGYGSNLHSINSDLKKTIFVAKFTDGNYYRAKVISSINAEKKTIKMYFIDYGNIDDVPIKNIRVLPTSSPLCQIQPTASNFYLAGLLSNYNAWHPQQLDILNKLLNYTEYNICSQSTNYPLISIEFENADLATYLLSKGFGMEVPIIKQELMLLSFMQSRPQPKSHPEVNHNQVRPNISTAKEPFHITNMTPIQFTQPPPQIRPPCVTNPRLPILSNPRPSFVNSSRAPFGNFSVPPPVQNAIPSPLQNTMTLPTPNFLPQEYAVHSSSEPKQPNTFKHTTLDINFTDKVLVSYVSNGTGNFTVQLHSSVNQLKYMMSEINKRPYHSLHDCPAIGEVCLGRSAYIKMIARAIVSSVSSQGCQLYFVDYGGDEFVHYYDIFRIPQEFILQPTIAIQICLSGIQNIKWNCNLDKSFRVLVTDKVLTLRVMPPEGPPLVHYGELYYNQRNVLNLIMMDERNDFEFLSLPSLLLGIKASVLVSYVDSCVNFFVQLLSNIKELNVVMEAVKAHCEQSVSPGELEAGSACCAKFPDDGNWYRARVIQPKGQKSVVAYVDYGNEQEVHVNDLRSITNNLVLFPAQAIRCALKGLEKGPIDIENSNRFEELTLEKTLTVHVVGRYSHDTMLVTLLDETSSPPLDITKTITEPNITNKTKNRGACEIYKTPQQVKNEFGRNRDNGAKPISTESSPVENWREFNRQRNNEQAPTNEGNLSTLNRRDDRNERASKFDHNAINNTDGNTNRNKLAPNLDYILTNKRDNNVRRSEQVLNHGRNTTNNKKDESEHRSKHVPNNEPSEDHIKRDVSAQRSDGSDRRRRGRNSRDKRPRNPSQSQESPPKPEGITKDVPDPVDDDADYSEQDIAEGSTTEVTVTWLTSPESFYVQPLIVQPQLEETMREIAGAYRSVRAGAGAARAVVARYPADRALYRAAVLERRAPSRVLVRYVDFGNKALVADSDCWRLTRSLLQPPRLALHCGLRGVCALPAADRSGLDARFGAASYSCTVGKLLPDGRRSVTLVAPDGTDVAAALLAEGLALADAPPEPAIGEPHYVAHVDSPGQFWLHSLRAAEELEQMQAELAARADEFPPLEESSVGALGCARYSADERWYRAEVLDADADITTVRFVDYGNTDVLGPHALRRLPDELAAPGPLAARCKLHAAPGGTGEWSEAAAARFEELVLAADDVDARVLLGGETLCVELRAGGVDPAAVLVAEGLASADREVREPCFASHVGSPDEFWIQLETAAGELQEIEEAMAAAETFPAAAEAEEGALVAAEFPEDGLWYRAQVVARGTAGTEVLFVDYGNACMAEELRALPSALRARPALSRQCALRRARPGRWSRRAEARFAELAAEGATVFGVRFVASGDRSVVDLYLEDQSVANILHAVEDEEGAADQAELENAQPKELQAEIQQAEVPQSEVDTSQANYLQSEVPVTEYLQTDVLQIEDHQTDILQTKDVPTNIPQSNKDDVLQNENLQLVLQTEDLQTDVLKTEDFKTDDVKPDIIQTKDLQIEDLQTDVLHTKDLQSDVPQAEVLKADYLQTEDLPSDDTQSKGQQSNVPPTEYLHADNVQTVILNTENLQNEGPGVNISQSADRKNEAKLTEIPLIKDVKISQPEYSKCEVLEVKEQLNGAETELQKVTRTAELQVDVPQTEDQQIEILQTEVSLTEILQSEDLQKDAPQTEVLETDDLQTKDFQSDILQTKELKSDVIQTEGQQRNVLPSKDLHTDNRKIVVLHTENSQSEGLRVQVCQSEDLQNENLQTEIPQNKVFQLETQLSGILQSEDLHTKILQTEYQQSEYLQTENSKAEEMYGETGSLQHEVVLIEKSQSEIPQSEDRKNGAPQTEDLEANDLQTKDLQSDILHTKELKSDVIQTECQKRNVLPTKDLHIDDRQTVVQHTKKSQGGFLRIQVCHSEDSQILQTEIPQNEVIQLETHLSEIIQSKDLHTNIPLTEDLQTEILQTKYQQSEYLQTEGTQTENPKVEETQEVTDFRVQHNISLIEEPQSKMPQSDVPHTGNLKIEVLHTESPQSENLGPTITEDSILQREDIQIQCLNKTLIPQTVHQNNILQCDISQDEDTFIEILQTKVLQTNIPQTQYVLSNVSQNEDTLSEIPQTKDLKTLTSQTKESDVLPNVTLNIEFLQSEDQQAEISQNAASHTGSQTVSLEQDPLSRTNDIALEVYTDSSMKESQNNKNNENINQDKIFDKEDVISKTNTSLVETDVINFQTNDNLDKSPRNVILEDNPRNELLEDNSFIEADSINENTTFKSCDLENDFENESVHSNEFHDANYDNSLNNDNEQNKLELDCLHSEIISKKQNTPTEEYEDCQTICDNLEDSCDKGEDILKEKNNKIGQAIIPHCSDSNTLSPIKNKCNVLARKNESDVLSYYDISNECVLNLKKDSINNNHNNTKINEPTVVISDDVPSNSATTNQLNLQHTDLSTKIVDENEHTDSSNTETILDCHNVGTNTTVYSNKDNLHSNENKTMEDTSNICIKDSVPPVVDYSNTSQ